MIELDKKDVAGIARRRFMKRNEKKFYGIFVGLIVLLLAAMWPLSRREVEGFDWLFVAVAGLIMAGWFVAMWLWYRTETKVVTAFVKEVEENGVSYKPEPVKGIVAHGE